MNEEQYGTRGLEYSAFHRRFSLQRYVGIEKAQLLSLIDLDAAVYIEYDDGTREPLAIFECARDVGQKYKAVGVIRKLAMRARLPAYCVLYRCGNDPNPADPRWKDIRALRVKRIWPRPEAQWRQLTPNEWAQALLQIRAWSTKRLDAEAANDPRY